MSKHILIHHRHKIRSRKNVNSTNNPSPAKETETNEEAPVKDEAGNKQNAIDKRREDANDEPTVSRSSAGAEQKDITD